MKHILKKAKETKIRGNPTALGKNPKRKKVSKQLGLQGTPVAKSERGESRAGYRRGKKKSGEVGGKKSMLRCRSKMVKLSRNSQEEETCKKKATPWKNRASTKKQLESDI